MGSSQAVPKPLELGAASLLGFGSAAQPRAVSAPGTRGSCLIFQEPLSYIDNSNNLSQRRVSVHGLSPRNLQGGNVGLITEVVWGKVEGTVCDCGHIDGIGA